MEELLDERVEGHAPIGTRVTIRLPDDFHHHCRDGAQTVAVLRDAAPRFGRCLMMPNLQPPITTAVQALAYKQRILDAVPPSTFNRHSFEPLMVLYLTDKTKADEIRMAAANGLLGCKYYPAGATTNSEFGVTNPKHCQEALNEMERLQLVLCIHSEVTYGDIFTRESTFLEEVLIPLLQNHPNLSITLEHISTREAVDYVLNRAPPNVKASITCHHLLYNRNDLLVGGIRPHLYCLPILKAEEDRVALLQAATSGSLKFFLGTDSAPHATHRKLAACGCAGVYTAHAALELYAEAFDRVGAMDRLEDFAASYGADHYRLPRSTTTITLEKTAWEVPHVLDFGDGQTVTPLRAGETVRWKIVDRSDGNVGGAGGEGGATSTSSPSSIGG